MFLFILESIGTPELILIAVVALIVLGPRKLPQIAKTAAKTMAEFRNATNEFKSTWEREVAFEDELKKEPSDSSSNEKILQNDNFSVSRDSEEGKEESTEDILNPLPVPEIKELTSEDIKQNFQIPEAGRVDSTTASSEKEKPGTNGSNKQDWL